MATQKTDLWKAVQKGTPEECWPCTLGSGDGRGHKQMFYGGRKIYAHRIAYELTYGSIPIDKMILHLCANPACCNPAHLKAGTASENVKQAYVDNPNLRASREGIHNGRSKLTIIQILEIRNSSITHAACGRIYGVSEVTIGRIRKGLRYENIR